MLLLLTESRVYICTHPRLHYHGTHHSLLCECLFCEKQRTSFSISPTSSEIESEEIINNYHHISILNTLPNTQRCMFFSMWQFDASTLKIHSLCSCRWWLSILRAEFTFNTGFFFDIECRYAAAGKNVQKFFFTAFQHSIVPLLLAMFTQSAFSHSNMAQGCIWWWARYTDGKRHEFAEQFEISRMVFSSPLPFTLQTRMWDR